MTRHVCTTTYSPINSGTHNTFDGSPLMTAHYMKRQCTDWDLHTDSATSAEQVALFIGWTRLPRLGTGATYQGYKVCETLSFCDSWFALKTHGTLIQP